MYLPFALAYLCRPCTVWYRAGTGACPYDGGEGVSSHGCCHGPHCSAPAGAKESTATHFPNAPETEVDLPPAWEVPEAVRNTNEPGNVEPGPAAQDSLLTGRGS